MIIPLLYVLAGLILLVFSADRFVAGSAVTARHLGMPSLLIGMLVVGFGTSAPEMMVSALSAYQGNPGIALGNAYGSNICNIALILGITAIINPISVHSGILKKELPVLTLVTLVSIFVLMNGRLSRFEAVGLLTIFAGLISWSLYQQKNTPEDTLGLEMEKELSGVPVLPLNRAVFWMVLGLALLIFSSRLLVSGAVEIAQLFGVSDLIIGLTIVAIGTSLPELASSIAAALKNEHDIALGNIIGSNLFNTLAVVGIAGSIAPVTVDPDILTRDLPFVTGLTVSLFIIGYGFKNRPGRVNRIEGLILLSSYISYIGWIIFIH